MTEIVEEETVLDRAGASTWALGAMGAGIIAILFATTSGFFLTFDKYVAFTVAIVPPIVTTAWILRRELDRRAWLAAGFSAILGFIAFATSNFLFSSAYSANYSLLYGPDTVGRSSVGEMTMSAVGRLVLMVVMAGIGILAAEGVHLLTNRPPRAAVAAQQDVPVREASEVLKQVGTTEDGKPLYVAVRGPDVHRGHRRDSGTNTLAILALVFGLAGGLPAIPLGHIALIQIKRTGDAGRGMAIAGLVLGYAWVAFIMVYFIIIAVAIARFQ